MRPGCSSATEVHIGPFKRILKWKQIDRFHSRHVAVRKHMMLLAIDEDRRLNFPAVAVVRHGVVVVVNDNQHVGRIG